MRRRGDEATAFSEGAEPHRIGSGDNTASWLPRAFLEHDKDGHG
ncbi:hypothetical protein [Streptomyces heilongjiangensis]|uniref:Uncharacterized protein n=1 Tax=Streptomyces heilongjiangensis TaxID=945052 RepID=A0ABW1B919_9ACTN|nr:hypothetical protein [Streptomyces heilongjiangensis]MDC2947171.1 hypothetical protein [Streptomyces heilongjiangensis]